MTQLRDQMFDASLLTASCLSQYSHIPPDQLSVDQLQAYFLYLVKERHLSDASCRLSLNALRFFYLQVLKRANFDVSLQVSKRKQRIPELLQRSEIVRIVQACENLKHRTLLLTCYGCGLRVSELVKLKLRHIDSERSLLRIEQGKGGEGSPRNLAPGLSGKAEGLLAHPTCQGVVVSQ